MVIGAEPMGEEEVGGARAGWMVYIGVDASVEATG